MTFLNDLLNIITTNTASDYITALVIILIFTVIGPMLSTCIIKLFRIKEKRITRIKRNAFYKLISTHTTCESMHFRFL